MLQVFAIQRDVVHTGAMSALSNASNFVSVVEYLRGEELSDVKHEYLNGMAHAMAGGTLGHSRTARNITLALGNRLRGKRCHVFTSDAAVHLSKDQDERFYYPDAVVTCGPFDPSARSINAPVVIFEVLSPTTARTDRTEKKDAYLACDSMQHYVLVEPETVEVTVYSRESSGWTKTVYNETDDILTLTGIEVELPLSEIYQA